MAQHRTSRRTPLDVPLILFLVSAVIGFWVAYDRSLSWRLLLTLFGSVALYWAITWPGFGSGGLRRLAWLLLALQSGLAFYFITQFNHLGYPVEVGFISHLGRLTTRPFPDIGLFYPHNNALATFIEGGIPLSVGLWVTSRSGRERLAAGLCFGLLGYGLLLTVSLGAWVALAACAALALVVRVARPLSRGRRVAGLLAFLALATISGLAITLVSPATIPELASRLVRGELYYDSLYLIRDYPLLGIGLGTFGQVYSKYILLIPNIFLTYAHNLFLSIWLNQGLLGVTSFGWILIAFYVKVIRQRKNVPPAPLFWGTVMGFTAMLVHGLIDSPQYADSRWIMPVFFGLLGLAVAQARSARLATTATAAASDDGKARSRRAGVRLLPNQRRRIPLLATLLAVTVAAVFVLPDTLYANLGALDQARADLDPGLAQAARQDLIAQADREFQKALEFDAQQPVAHWHLGLIALNADRFSDAIQHLEIARLALPGHRGLRKALGYAYLWDRQIQRAADALEPFSEVAQELETWIWWRGTQGQRQLARYAMELLSRLRQDQ